MPSCDRFLDDLLSCLEASDCVAIHKEKPRKCLGLLPPGPPSPSLTEEDRSTLDPRTPLECWHKARLYAECRLNLFNPRRRFRGSFGGRPEPEELPDEPITPLIEPKW